MTKKLPLLFLLAAVLALGAATAAQAAKIDICHFPPGNPDNWHTITINDTALPAHQAHGDLVGSCLTNCGAICDDGNKCTIDVVASPTECLCQAETRPPVDCNDGRACTTDSCDPAQGCLTTPVVCQAPDLCTASVCSEPAGTCQETPVVCPAGQTCNPSNGACESTTPVCPCTSIPGFNEVLAGANSCQETLPTAFFLSTRASIASPYIVVNNLSGFGACGYVGPPAVFRSITDQEAAGCIQLLFDTVASRNLTCI